MADRRRQGTAGALSETPSPSRATPTALTNDQYRRLLQGYDDAGAGAQHGDLLVERVPHCCPELLNVAMEKLLCCAEPPRLGMAVVVGKAGLHRPTRLFPRNQRSRGPLQECALKFGKPRLVLDARERPELLRSVCTVRRAPRDLAREVSGEDGYK
eukprot:evm.model.scf_671.4 EVM.evm.TU.scf_671.4   scf_671:3898-4362(+)